LENIVHSSIFFGQVSNNPFCKGVGPGAYLSHRDTLHCTAFQLSQ